MEKRHRKRFSVLGDVTGRAIMVADVDICDLSLSGMRFECCARIVPRSRIKLVINRKDLKVVVQGNVVRSSLKRKSNPRCEEKSFYEVAVRFDSTDGSNREALKKLINLIEKDDRSG